jgi:hypothetical protein
MIVGNLHGNQGRHYFFSFDPFFGKFFFKLVHPVLVGKVLRENDCLWQFEPFKAHDRPQMISHTEEGDEIMLVFRECMIRQSLFKFGHHQKGSLCNMMYGFFSGALKNIMGKESNLEILHAGENGCYKRLIVFKNS